MRRLVVAIAALLIVTAGGYFAWQHLTAPLSPERLKLYGDIDIRQVDLSFKVAGRIAQLNVDEGDRVRRGQVLAALEKSYFDDDLRLEQARLATLGANLSKLKNGSRPEEVDEARAALAERKASFANAEINFARQQSLLRSHVTSQQNYDNAAMTLHTADAQVKLAQAALDLVVAGPRREDIDAAQAQFDTEQAQRIEMERRLADADLVAPNDGVVLTRAREAGTIVQPGETVFTLTLDRPVWVRAYVDERNLGRIRPGMRLVIHTDAAGGKLYHGSVGFISPLAEFTPKSVETPALRTDLVYRLRVVVGDADEGLRQGMPVTAIAEDGQ